MADSIRGGLPVPSPVITIYILIFRQFLDISKNSITPAEWQSAKFYCVSQPLLAVLLSRLCLPSFHMSYPPHLLLEMVEESNVSISSGSHRLPVRVFGHSYVYWEGAYANSSRWGPNLGLGEHINISWLGRRGMRWPELLEAVAAEVRSAGPPAALIIHLGGNDLPSTKRVQLKMSIIGDLVVLQRKLPGTKIIWSNIVERRFWRGAISIEAVNRSVRKINAAVSSMTLRRGGLVARHDGIMPSADVLYRGDGIHLSAMGLELWLNSIRTTLFDWLRGCVLAGAGPAGPALVAGDKEKEPKQVGIEQRESDSTPLTGGPQEEASAWNAANPDG
ncbi:uncharacterized protein LOC143839266 isoform X2 [Paroedura picta]|uniref:uncharacterized protein LOC143839266 isoform X2 n=1 Tax=Paroedura picta TaxID=143630 RepID=UPI004055B6A7